MKNKRLFTPGRMFINSWRKVEWTNFSLNYYHNLRKVSFLECLIVMKLSECYFFIKLQILRKFEVDWKDLRVSPGTFFIYRQMRHLLQGTSVREYIHEKNSSSKNSKRIFLLKLVGWIRIILQFLHQCCYWRKIELKTKTYQNLIMQHNGSRLFK